MQSAKMRVTGFVKDESGQDLIEYALVAGLIGLGCVAAMTALSTKIATAFNSIGSQLASAV
jgi:pilus assembly protein Flp/PilA